LTPLVSLTLGIDLASIILKPLQGLLYRCH